MMPTKYFSLNLKNKFLIPTILVMFISFLIFTIYLIGDQRAKNEARLKAKSDRMTYLIASSNVDNIWDFNEIALKNNCDAFFQDNEIISIIIKDEYSELINMSRKVKGTKDILKKRDILKNDIKIGVTEVIYTNYHIEKNLTHIRNKLILLSGIMFFLITILISLVSNIALKPLKDLMEGVKHLTEKDLRFRIQIRSQDELGKLAASFNTMSEELYRHQEHLEELVAARTIELAQANAEIRTLNEKLKAENLRMSAELDITRRLQQMILPSTEELKNIEGLDIACFMEPADEVGGDYYDVLQHNGRVKIGIGDVTGHGLESGVLMLMTQTAVRTLLASDETDPVRFLNILNRIIYDNVNRMKADKSLTLALLDYHAGILKLSGQHEEMILVRQDGMTELVDTINLGFPIGLEDNISEFIDEASVFLQPGDGVVLYTDGITEAENADGELYGIERLRNVISKNWGKSAKEVQDAVIEEVRQYIGAQKIYDDLTLVIVKQQRSIKKEIDN